MDGDDGEALGQWSSLAASEPEPVMGFRQALSMLRAADRRT